MKSLLMLAAAAFLGSQAFAGSPVITSAVDSKKAVIESTVEVPRLLFRLTSSYVFESDFERGNNASGDALHNEFDLGYRVPISIGLPSRANGTWYLRLGARYSRIDFDNSGGLPLPNTLQSVAGVIGLEYLERGEIGFLIQTRPGFYFEHDIDLSTFDSPTTVGFAIPVTDNFYGIIGASASLLRSYPVLPSLGFLWKPNSQWTIYAAAPEPRITYQPNEHLAIWVGGELAGGAFRVDASDDRNTKLNRAVVTYSEYRASAGLTWSAKNCALEVGGGYAFQRKFDYNRAEEGYATEGGAPFVRAELRCAF